MNKKILMFIVFIMVSLLLVAGSVQAEAEDVLRVAMVADITTLDPQKANDIYSANVMKQIYNNLVKINKEMEIVGDLAESWENPDSTTWIFNLKKGVKFHNGEEFTASDVKFTIERLLDPETMSPGTYLLEAVSKVNVIDKYTIELKTKEPFAPLLSNLARYEISMLNEKAVKAKGKDYAKFPIGTGPFIFEEHHYGDKVILSKFDGYFEGPAGVDKIIYRSIPEDATRVVELESGGLDIMYNLPPQEFNRLSNNDSIKIIEVLGQATLYMGFNTQIKPFDNKKVRQALNYAVNKEAVIEAVFFGMGSPSYGPISPSIWGFDKSLPRAYPYNPEKAKKLLAEAGYPDGFECIIWTDPRTERKSISELVQAFLAQVGVKANIEIMEWSSFLSKTSNGADGMFILGYTGTGDADGGLYPRFNSKYFGSSNRHRWGTDELDKLLDLGRITVNTEERKRVYKEIQSYIIENAPDIFIALTKNLAATTKNVDGFELYPSNINPLHNVKIN